MSRHRRNKNNITEVDFLNNIISNNGVAMSEGPRKKKWTIHDLYTQHPLTPAQEDVFHAYYNKSDICMYGTAGTGKTYIALYLAIEDIITQRSNKHNIIIVRSAVEPRHIGFLPGTLDEKIQEYEKPYVDIFSELFGRGSTYYDMKNANIVRFLTTSFLRGLTWDNSIVIIDEGQNLTFHEINTVMSRIGTNSRVIFIGDLAQSDLSMKRFERTGMEEALQIMCDMVRFSCVEFTQQDIVRGDFVRDWIISSERVLVAA